MIKISTLAASFAMFFASSHLSEAQNLDLVTSSATVVCLKPENIIEGLKAAIENDFQWQKEIDCAKIKPGKRAILIDVVPYGTTFLWKIRLNPGQDNSLTVWTHRGGLVSKNGQQLDERGKPKPR